MGDIEIILLPYAVADGNSLLHRLIAELGKPDWTALRCAVAFAKQSGNYDQLLQALVGFARAWRQDSPHVRGRCFQGRRQGFRIPRRRDHLGNAGRTGRGDDLSLP